MHLPKPAKKTSKHQHSSSDSETPDPAHLSETLAQAHHHHLSSHHHHLPTLTLTAPKPAPYSSLSILETHKPYSYPNTLTHAPAPASQTTQILPTHSPATIQAPVATPISQTLTPPRSHTYQAQTGTPAP
ncbi:hypothetical protein HanRHA438_Chr02g0096591 [Helianthus annuus]|nr:hypothetical protein HanIR_Chr02g0098551 [Helianthus annuus]KAJ0941634.1 hypothetical protein HanRHA438_Chr02g0096591 [Helianthus annuus]